MPSPRIVPELYPSDFVASLHFYTRVLGFGVVYARPEDRFAYLDLDGAELMLEQTTDPARTFIAGEPEHPFGRGMYLQIEVEDVEGMCRRVLEAGSRVLLPLEDRWYRQGGREAGRAAVRGAGPGWVCAAALPVARHTPPPAGEIRRRRLKESAPARAGPRC